MKAPISWAECVCPSRLLRIISTGLNGPFMNWGKRTTLRTTRGTRAWQAQGQIHSTSPAGSPARDIGKAPARHLAVRPGRCAVRHGALDAPLPERNRARVRLGERARPRRWTAIVESSLG